MSLYAVQGYRDADGRVHQHTVKAFCFFDELEKDWPDSISHFGEVVAQMDAERLAAEDPQTTEIYPRQKINKHASFFGSAAVRYLTCVHPIRCLQP